MVRVTLSGPGFRSGLYGRLVLLQDMRKELIIPWRAIVIRGEITGMYVIDEKNIVHFRVVRLGSSFKEGPDGFLPVAVPSERAEAKEVKDLMVEILSGLTAGEVIVISPLDKIREGDLVTVSP